MRIFIHSLLASFLTFSAFGHPASDTPGKFHDWFQNLKDNKGRLCCTESDCRFVDSKFDIKTKKFQAKLERENYLSGVRSHFAQASVDSWTKAWIRKFGDVEEVWIDIPLEKTNLEDVNPTGHAVLCWTPYDGSADKSFDGIYCFLPVTGM